MKKTDNDKKNGEEKVEEGQEEKETEEEGEKSLTEEDLQKSLDRLASFADDGNPESRKKILLEKAQSGESLDKAEQDELFTILGGGAASEEDDDEAPSLAKSVTENLEGNEGLQKALDVSEYLQEQHSELVKSLGKVADHIEASDSRQHEFNLVLSQAFANVGNLVKAMSMRLGVLEEQPARAPKSKGVGSGAVLQKAFGGGEAAEDAMSKGQVLDIMDEMLRERMDKGQSGVTDFGEDISVAVAKFESVGAISPAMHAEVQKRARNAA